MITTSTLATTYDFSKFTKEDRTLYKKALLDLPYNPEWAEFFYSQKKLQKHLNNHRDRHNGTYESSDVPQSVIDYTTPEDVYIEKESWKKYQDYFTQLSDQELNRLILHDIGKMTYRKIGEEENVHWFTVRNSVVSARSKIVNFLKQSRQ